MCREVDILYAKMEVEADLMSWIAILTVRNYQPLKGLPLLPIKDFHVQRNTCCWAVGYTRSSKPIDCAQNCI